MTATIEHSPDQAKKLFKLGSGVGDGKTTACAMSALAWVHGYAFSDTMPCAHRTLRSLVISANDAPGATEAQRWALFDAGEAGGVVDTWWVPTEVVVSFIAQVIKDASRVDQALDVLGKVKAWKEATNKGEKPDLRGADLSYAVLRGADLSYAVLRGADLSYADLSYAVLSGAVLSGADLSYADLSGADLSYADLSGADLRGAYGKPWTGMPDGWKLNDSGIWEKAV